MREHWNKPVSFLQFRLSNRSLRGVVEAAIVRAPIQSRDEILEQPPNVRSLAATCALSYINKSFLCIDKYSVKYSQYMPDHFF